MTLKSSLIRGNKFFLCHNSLIINRFALSVILFLSICITVWSQPDCEIIDYRTYIKVNGPNLITEKNVLIKVNSAAASWVTDISLSFQKGDRLEILNAEITDDRGKIVRKLKKEEIQTVSDISEGTFYEDTFSRKFSMPWGEYPYFIQYSYRETTDKFIYLTRWSPYLYSQVPVHQASLSVELPADANPRLFSKGNLTFNKSEKDNRKIYLWSAAGLQAVKPEYFSPPAIEIVPRVTVVREEFMYVIKGRLTSWESFGFWIHELINGLDVLPDNERQNVRKLIAGVTDEKEKVRLLYYYLQDNTHYVNVSVETGGLKPYPATYVSENKYGDCKALTIYMKALLKEAGIESYYTPVWADRRQIKIDTGIPGPQFNHVFLCVPLDNDTVWIENTAGFIPCGYAGTSTQGRLALFVDGEKSKLVMTPAMNEADVTDINTYNFNLNEAGNGTVVLSKHLRGRSYETFVAYKVYLSDKEMHSKIANIIPFSNFDLTAWKFNDHKREDPFMDLTCMLKVRNQIRVIGKTLVITPIVDDLPQIEKPEERNLPVRLDYPFSVIDTMNYSIELFRNYSPILPENVSIKSKFGSYEITASEKNNEIKVIRKLLLNRGDYQLDEYDAFYGFIKAIKESVKKTQIIINPA